MPTSSFPSQVTGVTVETATTGALAGDGSSLDKLAVSTDGSTIVVNGSNELEVDASLFPALDATYLTLSDETGTLTGSRQLLAGDNITLDATTPGELTIAASGGGSFDPASDQTITGDWSFAPASGDPVEIVGLTVTGSLTAPGVAQWIGPYKINAFQGQTILTGGGDVDGGTFTLTLEGQTTAPIAWNASQATFLAARGDCRLVERGRGECVYAVRFILGRREWRRLRAVQGCRRDRVDDD
jgi:hypothetical protein